MTGIRYVPTVLVAAAMVAAGMLVRVGAQPAHADEFVPVSISGSVFEDRDGNGVYDPNDMGLDDWMVYLFDGDALVQYTATMGGTFTFPGVGPGTFTVLVEPPVGWLQTAAPSTNPATTSSGVDVTGLDFGYFLAGYLSGHVLQDQTGDGFSPDDTAFPAPVTVELFAEGNSAPIATVSTQPGGIFIFYPLLFGVYTVQEVVPAGYVLSAQVGATTYGYSGFRSEGNDFDNFGTLAVTMLPVQPVEGAQFTGPVARLTTGDARSVAGDFTATVEWGDGAVSAGAISGDPSGGFLVSGGHTYAEEGNYTLGVRVSATGGSAATASEGVTVTDAALHARGVTLPATGSTFSGVVATFTDDDPNGVSGDYSARIDWGDGTTSIGTISAGTGGGFVVNSGHAFAEGSFTITTTVDDQGGASASAMSTITVDRTPPTTAASVTGNVLTLSASDNLTGVAATYYSVNGGPAQLYRGPVTLKNGKSTIQFWSVDGVGNTEPAHTIRVKG